MLSLEKSKKGLQNICKTEQEGNLALSFIVQYFIVPAYICLYVSKSGKKGLVFDTLLIVI